MEYDYVGDVSWVLVDVKNECKAEMSAAPDVAAALDKMLRIKKPWMMDAYEGYISYQTRGVVKGTEDGVII